MMSRIFAAIALLTLAGCSSAQVAQRMAAREAEDDAACRSVQMDYAACRAGLAEDRQRKKVALIQGLNNLAAYSQHQQDLAVQAVQPQVIVACPFGRVC